MSVWRLYPVESEIEPPAETFLAKLRRLFMGQGREKRRRQESNHYQCSCCFLILVIIFISSSIGCIIMWFTDLYLDSILNQMVLKDGTEIFEAWKSPPVKPLICVHIYNYTNIEDYRKGKSNKIKVVDTGPYCYRETLEKTNIKFNDDGTVTYGDRRTHVFEPKNSSGSMDDILIVPNLPLISAAAMARKQFLFFQLIVDGILKMAYDAPMVKITAHEFIFGYNDTLVSTMEYHGKFFDKEIPFKKFGILVMRATETNERITVKTGAGDLENIGVVTAVNGHGNLSAWDDPFCNRVDGSDGAFFPRHTINKSTTLYLFHKDLCRKLPLVYQEEVDFQDGVMGMRFHVPPNVYNATGTCYCKGGVCPPEGIFDVSPCAEGAPLLMSFPHYLNADPAAISHLEGIHPDPKRHDFFIDINPILGFTLGTVSRIQVNIQIRKPERLSMLDDFPDGTILPIVWFEVTADRLPPDLFKMIYHASVTVQWIQWFLQWSFLAIFSLSALGLLLSYCRHKQLQHSDVINSQKSENLRINQLRHKDIIVEKVSSI